MFFDCPKYKKFRHAEKQGGILYENCTIGKNYHGLGGIVNLALVTLTKMQGSKKPQPDTSVFVGKAERIRKPITGKKIREGH